MRTLRQTRRTTDTPIIGTDSPALLNLENGFSVNRYIVRQAGHPAAYRKRLRTTNSLERLNQEIRRRERVIRIFPNRESAVRLIGAVLMEQDELWSTGHRYLRMETYWTWHQEQRASSTSFTTAAD